MKSAYQRDQELQQRLEELEQQNIAPPIEPPPSERIRYLLERFEEGNINMWVNLNREMTLAENSRTYGSPFNTNLLSLIAERCKSLNDEKNYNISYLFIFNISCNFY